MEYGMKRGIDERRGGGEGVRGNRGFPLGGP